MSVLMAPGAPSAPSKTTSTAGSLLPARTRQCALANDSMLLQEPTCGDLPPCWACGKRAHVACCACAAARAPLTLGVRRAASTQARTQACYLAMVDEACVSVGAAGATADPTAGHMSARRGGSRRRWPPRTELPSPAAPACPQPAKWIGGTRRRPDAATP